MSGRPVKMAPELRTSLFAETVLAALHVGADSALPVRVETTGPYTATLSLPESNRWGGGMKLALTTCVGGVSQAVVSAAWRPAPSEAGQEYRMWQMARLGEAIEAQAGVTEAVLDEVYATSILVHLSYGRLRIIREGDNG